MTKRMLSITSIIALLVISEFGVSLRKANAATYTGTFTPTTQSFFYSINVGAGDRLVITEIAGECNAPDTWINVRDSSNNIIAFNDDSGVGGCEYNSQVSVKFSSGGLIP